MEYRIIKAKDQDTLERNIKRCFENGWELQGGVSVCVDHYGAYTYAQAVIKRDWE